MARAFIAFIAVLNIALAVFAISVLRHDIRNSDVVLVGGRIGNAEEVSPDVIMRIASSPTLQNLLGTCRSDILRFGLWTHLAILDTVNAQSDQAQWRRYAGNAKTLIDHAERCNPANGDVWLRDAMISRALGGQNAEDFRSKVMLSAALMPNYGHEVSARLTLWSSMDRHELAPFDDVVVADLSVGLRYFDQPQARQLLARTPENLRPFLARALGTLPKTRVAELISQ